MDNKSFNPNTAADPNAGIYGLPYSFQESQLIYIPVAWEATTSYGGGTFYGPEAILNASPQLDVFDIDVVEPYSAGLHCLPADEKLIHYNIEARELAQTIKDAYGIVTDSIPLQKNLSRVNKISETVNEWVKEKTSYVLNSNKIAAIIGGDHSVPFGAFQAVAEKFGSFGILHFDAHSDTRSAYMGFEYSHASIMHNAATKIPEIIKFVQVGIRDFCDDEFQFVKSQGPRFEVFYDSKIAEHKLKGLTFHALAEKMIENLPEKVWVSFDIDGLDPKYCPHTGTPVPGGLEYSEAVYIIKLLAQSGRKIIGFDLVEVSPTLNDEQNPIEINQAADEWDANVGMRLLYKMSAMTLASQKKATWQKI